MSIAFGRRLDGAATCPSLMVYLGRNAVGRRRCGEDIGDEAFVISQDGVLGCPPSGGAPVPIQHILPPLAVPVPLNSFPEGVGACSQLLFLFIAPLEVLPYTNQCLCHEGRFYQISTIVIFAEWLCLARGAIKPVRPCAAEAVCFREVIKYVLKTLHAVVPRDKATFHAHDDGHQPKSAPADGNDFPVVLRVFAIHVYALARKARDRLRAVPEILKRLTLHECQ